MSDSGSNDTESATDTGDSETDRSSRFRSLRARLDDIEGTSPSDDGRSGPSGAGSAGGPSLDSNGGSDPDGGPGPNGSSDRIGGDGTPEGGDSSARHDRGDPTAESDEWEWSTAAADADGNSGGGAETRGATEAADTDTGSTDTRAGGRSRDRGGRVWDRDDDGGTAADSGPPGSGGADGSGPAADGAARDGRDRSPDAGGESGLPVDADPGTSVLVQAESQDGHAEHVCHELLGLEGTGAAPRVLLVRYQELDPDRLARIAEGADRFTLIAIGYSQSVPASVDDVVDTVRITNPNDITRLGIVVSGRVEDWADDDRPVAFCLDSLNVVLNYRDVKSTFRFLHVLLNTLHGGGAVSHFHADPTAGSRQDLNTLKPLFDDVVAVDSTGVHTE
ncbi:DUF7504 family protein [Halorubrum salinum]|uniref:DUF7504 family protein n=1 Tax=Halorubrum salinum TaxID=767517 RepID=UPI002111F76F|nr:hypothetical protein [Halorubrum salinum]